MKIIYVVFVGLVMQSVFGMDSEVSTVPCTKITEIKNIMPDVVKPSSICYVRKGIVAVLGKDNKLVVRDIKNQQNIVTYDHNNVIINFAVNKQGTQVVFYDHGVIKVCNAVTGEIEWQNNEDIIVKNVHFSRSNDDQVICNACFYKKFIVHNKGKRNLLDVGLSPAMQGYIAEHHPLSTKIFMSSSYQGVFDCDYVAQTTRHIADPVFSKISFLVDQCFTADGSVLAMRAEENRRTHIAFLYLNKDGNKIEYLSSSDSLDGLFNKLYTFMLFHPNNKNLFLLNEDNTIECWDFKNNQCIHIIKFENQCNIRCPYSWQRRLAFSPHGKKLFVALENQCVMVRVPFDVLYSPDTIKNAKLIVCALQHCENIDITADVRYVIVKNLLKLYRNS